MNHEDAKAQRHEERREAGEGHSPIEPETEQLARRVIGAAIAVHQGIGPGFPEHIYEKALSLELGANGIRHACQHPISVVYRDTVIGEGRMDMLVEQTIVVELKAVDALNDTHRAQLVVYLKATGHRLGLLMNFNKATLKDGIRRVIN